MLVAALWVLLSAGVAALAYRRGRSVIFWFLFSIVLSPVIIGLVVLGLGDVTEKSDRKKLQTGEYKTCPFCGHAVLKQAVVCRHCARVLADGHSVVK